MTERGDDVEIAHFEFEADSAAAARRFVSTTLAAWNREPLDYVASLLVSELVSNVILHAGTDLDVVLRRAPGRVRIEVHDGDRRLPFRKHYSLTSATGRGLGLIEDLALDWGTQETPSGKVVWCELDERDSSFALPVSGDLGLDDWEDLADLESTGPGEDSVVTRGEQAGRGASGSSRAVLLVRG